MLSSVKAFIKRTVERAYPIPWHSWLVLFAGITFTTFVLVTTTSTIVMFFTGSALLVYAFAVAVGLGIIKVS